MPIFVIIFLTIPFLCILYITLQTIGSIWCGLIFYNKKEKDNLKWDIQRIILTSITVIYLNFSKNVISDDLFNNPYHPYDTEFLKFFIYPSILLIYYVVLFVVYYKEHLKNIKEIFKININTNHYGRKYFKFSWFILATMIFSIYWVLLSWLVISFNGWSQ